MLSAANFVNAALLSGFDFFTGVPCSLLTPLVNETCSRRDLSYVVATSEGEAVAIAAGAYLAGKKTVVMSQNSGLGNMINPLTSLNFPFRIPTLLIVTWRGRPGEPDEPQHELMGRITASMLALLEIPMSVLPSDENVAETFRAIISPAIASGSSYALITKKGDFAETCASDRQFAPKPAGAIERWCESSERPTRVSVLEHLLGSVADVTAIIATTGKTGRELYTLQDRDQHLYMVGAMGSASAVGLGVAMNSQKPVIVVDGDGAALMRMGTFATIGARGPENFLHILLDNGVHDSTGGQQTVSSQVDWASIAAANGYRHTISIARIEDFARALDALQSRPGPNCLHVRTLPGSIENLGRQKVAPHEVAERFSSFLRGRQELGRSRLPDDVTSMRARRPFPPRTA
ncbi:phosphonopyruvate decarboxylase [Bradyrhizobium sp. Cp5.3]|uniref:phosphonopyruvate decarboxylase n=1 Tax=Bradyrhizobium sp. Cp5.3 TaxID=443598 RepID=UPI0004183BFD|nr:phosphonopyruvate decarboxylase [Bradyrhizobium sp. Cp5.3]